MKIRTITLFLAILVVSVGLCAADDPMVGTWKVNVAKSKYDPGPPPQSGMNKYEAAGPNTLKLTQDGVDAKGEKTHAADSIVFDGKDHPTATGGFVNVNRRIDANTTERVRSKDGKIINYLFRVISPDGKTMTVKQVGITADGKPVSRIEVYDKQ